ncbi:Flp family type IVb pilin [Massilia sp.]|uniref:Flp family type IVb pilin n=1 Tax=Massilia sp. TaxID=1882437 RepID=UPI00289DEA8C|nr:Flp family type IVb pilin [Massilia sp.]
MTFIKNFIKDEDGVTAIEYALIAALIAGVIGVGAAALGTETNKLFDKLSKLVNGTVKPS